VVSSLLLERLLLAETDIRCSRQYAWNATFLERPLRLDSRLLRRTTPPSAIERQTETWERTTPFRKVPAASGP
jgi:hypothetical protein